MKSNDFVCTSCSQPKNHLKPKKSKLMNMNLYLCGECIEAKREPRFVIILHGRSEGWESIAEYIKHDRYIGEPITMKELL